MTDTISIPAPQKSPAVDEFAHLRDAARSAASWDVVHRPLAAGTFRERIIAARRALKLLEVEIASLPAAPQAEGDNQRVSHIPALLDLRANSRLLRAAISAVSNKPGELARLPRVLLPAQQDEPRIAAAANLYLRTVAGGFFPQSFQAFIRALQEQEPFTVGELWNIAAFLKFALLESMLEEAQTLLRSPESVTAPLLPVRLKSLRSIGHAKWVYIIEPLIAFDAILRQDPGGTYERMDFESREQYRMRVAIIARYSDWTESQVAQGALDLARQGVENPSEDPRIHARRTHVGYYLLDKGFPQLVARTGYYPPFIDRSRAFIRAHADDFFLTGIELLTILFIAAVLFPLLPHSSGFAGLLTALVLLLLPATQDAVDLVNNTVTALFDPEPLPKLDFSVSIPSECTTLVAIPSLLLKEEQVRELVTSLEVRFLANRDPHLHFALLTDLPDSVSKPRENDTHPLVELAIQLIDELNAKYTSPKCGRFVFLHRHRVFNLRQGVWMGWERKRGKLLDLNKFLAGEFDAFPIKAGNLDALQQCRYILTLDSDSQLPRGAAARLIGAIAHPLNQAVIDPKSRIVVEGYGILQPRIGIAVQSAARSRLAAIFSGQSGFDIYTRAISDAYQDLFGEGIFTGKGIYEVATLNAVFDRRFPSNSLLSHDLIEGSYARAGLVTDVELIDDYPSHYSAYSRRKHRWVRGDWQIVQWISSRVPEESGRWVRNPITRISRWKVFDNLRRSLVEPFLFILFVAGWLGLPGGPLYWTIVPLLLLIFPTLVQLAFSLGRALFGQSNDGVGEAFAGFWRSSLVVLLNLLFLPHQTLLAFDAIVRSLVRRFITGERLLEWETAAEAESHTASRTPADRYLTFMPLVAFAVATAVFFLARRSDAIFFAAPILLLWGFANIVTSWLNRPPREQYQRLDPSDRTFLLAQALRIWRYFHQFGAEEHNYLVPDNVDEDSLHQAARVSPTNLGLLLNARQAACEFGFLTVPEFVSLTSASLATVARLDKYHGHLYNWYHTQTLKLLDAAPFVSSVDSGNFVASLYTLHSGTLELARKPLFGRQLLSGLRAHWRLILEKHQPILLQHFSAPGTNAPVSEWIAWLPGAGTVLSSVSATGGIETDIHWWIEETQRRIAAMLTLVHDYLPWMLPEYKPLIESDHLGARDKTGKKETVALSLEDAIEFSEALDERLARAIETLKGDTELLAQAKNLRAAMPAAIRNLRTLAASLEAIAQDAERVAEETDFSILADPNRQILSIGYDMVNHRLHEACYDMLASEARIATFLAVARGDLPQVGWFQLGRDFAHAYGRFLLLSWTGTMFEYLMPSLWMRSYPDTLISRTQTACVYVHRAFARSLNIPWGISESGAASRDDMGNYSYHAYGVPQIALWAEATAGPVISPYSSFLALGVDSVEALRNLRRMASAGWVGAFGFYEAGDFTESTSKPERVREWMAHHQGMSLLAIVNLLQGNVVQRWFHANPLIQATELMLHEMPVSQGALRARMKEFAPVPSAAGAKTN